PNNTIQHEPEPLVLAGQSAPPYNNNAGEHAPVGQYQRGTMPRSAVPYEPRDSRFASIITVLILLATLLLLGFSIYLAAELHFIHIPGIINPIPTETNISLQFSVPDLRGLTYQDALTRAKAKGFKLKAIDGN